MYFKCIFIISCFVFSDLDLHTFLYNCCPIRICNVLVTVTFFRSLVIVPGSDGGFRGRECGSRRSRHQEQS